MPVSEAELERAAHILRSGGLVAFPTETVYGLGANALDPIAVRRIYDAKGRPSTSPLIVHISSFEMLPQVTAEWPERAQTLAERFWPGPLTLVLKKNRKVPDEVTAGLDTVGVRMPAHPIAQQLIGRTGLPLAAPSANRFTEVSPTTAAHVREALGDRVGLILDGGPCQVGIESTVLSLVEDQPALLRPGMVSAAEIERIIGPVSMHSPTPVNHAHASPGLHERHYSPRTPLVILDEDDALPEGPGRELILPGDPQHFAAVLYSELHEADKQGWQWIAIRRPPDRPEWLAVQDRLKRAGRQAAK
jgi:L-threonylcarbamoyladenylate synthase